MLNDMILCGKDFHQEFLLANRKKVFIDFSWPLERKKLQFINLHLKKGLLLFIISSEFDPTHTHNLWEHFTKHLHWL